VVADTPSNLNSYSSSSSSSSLENKNTKEKVDPAERTKNQIYNMHKRTPLFTPRTLFVKRFLAKWTNQLESSKRRLRRLFYKGCGIYIIRVLLNPQLYYFVNNK
jgi:hypothetical protein